MRRHLGIWAGKFAKGACKLFGKGGTSLPGKIALKIDPHLLKRLGEQVENILIVTGTNGKTTTSNLLSSIFSSHGIPIIHNRKGSNLIGGVTTAFLNQANLFGTIRNASYAILEVDEITLGSVMKQITPKAILITNFFRDQLDRFGEVDSLIERMSDVIKTVNTKLFLNADDPLSVRLSALGKDTIYFGLGAGARNFQSQTISESKFCPICSNTLDYSYIHFGHLGIYSCVCGFKRPPVSYEASHITMGEGIEVSTFGTSFFTQLKGDYNAYNVMGAIALSKEAGISFETIKNGLRSYISDNGRMQRYSCNGLDYLLSLAKNPQGVNASLSTFLEEHEEKQITIFLNDLGADGKDVSWIWDADYELLNRPDVKRIICSGRRAYDLAVRIQYANIAKDKIIIQPDIKKAIDQTTDYPVNSYFLSTYTALHTVMDYLKHHKNISQA